MRLITIAIAVAAVLAGCGAPKAEVTHVGPPGPPLPPDCPLAVSPGQPAGPVEDIAIIKVRCATGQCMVQLRDRACELGADVLHTVFSIRAGTYMQGTAARSTQVAVQPAPQPDPGGPPPEGAPTAPEGY